MSEDVKIYASLGDGKLVATLSYKDQYVQIPSEMATVLSQKLKKVEELERQVWKLTKDKENIIKQAKLQCRRAESAESEMIKASELYKKSNKMFSERLEKTLKQSERWRMLKSLYPSWKNSDFELFLRDCIYVHEVMYPEAVTRLDSAYGLAKRWEDIYYSYPDADPSIINTFELCAKRLFGVLKK